MNRIQKMISDARAHRGFTLIEIMMALILFSIVMGAVFGIFTRSQRSEEFGKDITEAQQNARAALDAITADLRAAGFGVDPTTDVPIEVASDYRITFLRDLDRDGLLEYGERITYFLDNNTGDPLVSDTDNPGDCVLRRVTSSLANPDAAPASGAGEVIAFGLTQRSTGGGWDTPLFAFSNSSGTDLLAGAADQDPTDPVWGRTAADSVLGKPAGGPYDPAIYTVTVTVITETARPNPQTGHYRRSRMSSRISPRNLPLEYLTATALNVATGTGTGTGTGGTGTGSGSGTGTGTGPVIPPYEPPIHIPTVNVLTLKLSDTNERDSQEGSATTVDSQRDLDIVLGTKAGASNNLAVWWNAQPGRYQTGTRLYNSVPSYRGTAAYDLYGVAVGPVNTAINSGSETEQYDDCVTAYRSSETTGGFYVWMNQGSLIGGVKGILGAGALIPTTPSASYRHLSTGKGQAIVLNDVDSDGDNDVILGTRTGANAGRYEVWFNDGLGNFTSNSSSDVYVAAGEVQTIVLGDFDADGKMDFAGGCRTTNSGTNGAIDVFFQTSIIGRFARNATYSSGGNVRSLARGRMNNDDALDLVAGTRTGAGTGQVEFWRNDGRGAFSRADVATADGPITAVAVGYINMDSRPDIVAGNEKRSLQVWFCDNTVSENVIPLIESWSDANTGGTVNAIAIGKIEKGRSYWDDDPLYDIVIGTAITSTTGEIVIYLNPYVDLLSL